MAEEPISASSISQIQDTFFRKWEFKFYWPDSILPGSEAIFVVRHEGSVPENERARRGRLVRRHFFHAGLFLGPSLRGEPHPFARFVNFFAVVDDSVGPAAPLAHEEIVGHGVVTLDGRFGGLANIARLVLHLF
jgi:hypothetical protein